MKGTSILAALAVFSCAPAALATNDWAFISTAGDPDPITSFDLANPGASNVGIGFVDGNFNRGMDFNTANSFYYYVSTDSLNQPGDRGLWYWNSGVNTQLFNTPFSDSTDGDATLSNDMSKFYVTTNDGSGGHSLYAFDNLNGAVTFTNLGNTGLTNLIGLAMDPISGLLYGYDSGTEGLYTINTSNGQASLVGFSGLSLGAIGGMDFSADGSTLLLSQGSNLYRVNKADGVLTNVGNVGLNTSALSYMAVPAPASLALLAMAGVFNRRRRSS